MLKTFQEGQQDNSKPKHASIQRENAHTGN